MVAIIKRKSAVKGMKIISDVVIQKVGGLHVAVAVGARAKELPCMIKLNESGAFLWKLATEMEEIDPNKLSAELAREYEISEDVAKADTERFIKSLVDNGLTEE